MGTVLRAESLSQYIHLLEDLEANSYAFRGQDNPYYGICASAFRPYKGGWDDDSIFDVQSLINDFYRRTIRNLNSREKEHFLAFSQHHGIPTDLVDFSTSPLVALFFASSTKQLPSFTIESITGKEAFSSVNLLIEDAAFQSILSRNIAAMLSNGCLSQNSFVYCFDRDRLIDITEVRKTVGFNEILMTRILDDVDIQYYIKSEIAKKYSKSQPIISYSLMTMIETLDTIACLFDVERKANSKFHDCLTLREDSVKNPMDLIRSIDCINPTIISDINSHSPAVSASEIYMHFLLTSIYKLTELDDKCRFDFYFLLTYNPPYLFDRLANQKGFFVNQLYLYKKDAAFDICVLHLQKITPDITIEIANPSKMYQQLRNYGIDSDTIYGDFDHVARAVLSDNPPINIRSMPFRLDKR